jgi:hypothetical protein
MPPPRFQPSISRIGARALPLDKTVRSKSSMSEKFYIVHTKIKKTLVPNSQPVQGRLGHTVQNSSRLIFRALHELPPILQTGNAVKNTTYLNQTAEPVKFSTPLSCCRNLQHSYGTEKTIFIKTRSYRKI